MTLKDTTLKRTDRGFFYIVICESAILEDTLTAKNSGVSSSTP